MMGVMLWLARYGHVVAGAIWVGGYALLALVIVPLMQRGTNDAIDRIAATAVRVLTYAGTATIFFGVLLITRTRGFANLLRGEWGALVLACVVIAIVLLGIGDGALRPALQRLSASGDGRAARRYAMVGFVLSVVAIGLMTRALYANS
jgi:putative copper export protein